MTGYMVTWETEEESQFALFKDDEIKTAKQCFEIWSKADHKEAHNIKFFKVFDLTDVISVLY